MTDAPCFTWHVDQDDVYDGAKCDSMTINGAPTAFNKDQPYSFTMTGRPDDTLTLKTTSYDVTNWPSNSTGKAATFNINSGKFIYNGGALNFGLAGTDQSNILVNIKSQMFLQVSSIIFGERGNTPAATIDIRENGILSAEASAFAGAYTVTISDRGLMKIQATNSFDLVDSKVTVDANLSPSEIFNLQTKLPGGAVTENISAIRSHIHLQSSSSARLIAKTLKLSTAEFLAENNSYFDISFDKLDIGGSSTFTLLPHYARFVFTDLTGNGKPPLVFDQYKGVFNFISTQGKNDGKFRFFVGNNNLNDARELWKNLSTNGLFAINYKITHGEGLRYSYNTPFLECSLA
ncbi:hypothetical protein GCM10011491_28600 [Brucella endophytica]|uniref:Uncharacterized protein n=1 Tax=Brucella endophytica TaxID=1963359 RepID=A0A916WHN7_9HYPH|nr:hypothetical protein [Brucella endophytica]GGA98626.1 hypothetical protein GCM10011491_28600 [Brucella endophytica]